MIEKEEREAVLRVIKKGELSGYQGNWSNNFYGGEEVKQLEKEWQEYFKVKHAIVCNSATSGLWLACAAIGLGHVPDYFDTLKHYEVDEVIVTPYSMTCSASIPLQFGAKPVFADIEDKYYCLDSESVKRTISNKTRAIIVVDLFGQPYDADVINKIAEEKGREYGHKIYVIEDAAQAIGATYKGQFAGTLGDIGVFSLNRHKHIQCGEGGVAVTNNDELAFKLRLLMNHAEAVMNSMLCESIHDVFSNVKAFSDAMKLVGMNLRMTELQACIAREQLKKLESILKKVREDSKYFPVDIRPNCEHAFYRYAMTDKTIMTHYSTEKIEDKFNFKAHYIKPLFKMPLFQQLGYPQDLCPVCEEVDKNIILAWHKQVL